MRGKTDIVSVVQQLAESGDHIDQLMRMPTDRLESVLALLSDRVAIEAFRRVLKTVVEMQRRTGRQLGARRHTDDEARSNIPDVDGETYAALGRIFADTTRFPSVPSIQKTVIEVFRVEVPIGQKQSRDRYIRTVIAALRENPKALLNAKSFLEKGGDKKDLAYSRLYDFIRGRLTDEVP